MRTDQLRDRELGCGWSRIKAGLDGDEGAFCAPSITLVSIHPEKASLKSGRVCAEEAGDGTARPW